MATSSIFGYFFFFFSFLMCRSNVELNQGHRQRLSSKDWNEGKDSKKSLYDFRMTWLGWGVGKGEWLSSTYSRYFTPSS